MLQEDAYQIDLNAVPMRIVDSGGMPPYVDALPHTHTHEKQNKNVDKGKILSTTATVVAAVAVTAIIAPLEAATNRQA